MLADPSNNKKEPVQNKQRLIDLQEQEQQQQYTIHNLPNELHGLSLSFLGAGHFRYGPFACKMLLKAYLATVSDKKITSGERVTLSISCAKKFFDDMNIPDDIETMEQHELEQLDQKISFFCNKAAKYGHLEVMKWGQKWLKERGCPFPLHHRTCRLAAGGGHLPIIEWLRENECLWDLNTCSSAARYGHLSTLKWARESGCPWDLNTCSYAARYGHLSILKWARENGCPWDSNTCSSAARYGHLSDLQWARENGCPWDSNTCSSAARCGHLSILKWARENGCPWDKLTCSSAARNGHLSILKWARENGCPA